MVRVLELSSLSGLSVRRHSTPPPIRSWAAGKAGSPQLKASATNYILIAAGLRHHADAVDRQKHVLTHEPTAPSRGSTATAPAARDSCSLEDSGSNLKDRYLQRFSMLPSCFRARQSEVYVVNGRIDGRRMCTLGRAAAIRPAWVRRHIHLRSGRDDRKRLAGVAAYGVDADRILYERFTPSGDAPPPARSREARGSAVRVSKSKWYAGWRAMDLHGWRERSRPCSRTARKAGLEFLISLRGGHVLQLPLRIVEGEAGNCV